MFASSLGPRARNFLKKCEKSARIRIEDKIESLEKDPFPSEVERVKGLKGRKAFRVRVGEYRIQYVIYQDKKHVLIFKIDKRARAYD